MSFDEWRAEYPAGGSSEPPKPNGKAKGKGKGKGGGGKPKAEDDVDALVASIEAPPAPADEVARMLQRCPRAALEQLLLTKFQEGSLSLDEVCFPSAHGTAPTAPAPPRQELHRFASIWHISFGAPASIEDRPCPVPHITRASMPRAGPLPCLGLGSMPRDNTLAPSPRPTPSPCLAPPRLPPAYHRRRHRFRIEHACR